MVIQTDYNSFLVVLSILVAISASYVALELSNSVTKAQGRMKHVWLSGGALAMGFGIWSMHFIGMLAMQMPGMSMSYDVLLLILSILIAVVASGMALFVISRRKSSVAILFSAGLALAAAIAGMHYVGMVSMRMNAVIEWNWLWVLISVVIALLASFAALFTALRLKHIKAPLKPQILASILLGFAIVGMHYTGMEAATFVHDHQVAGIEDSSVLATSGLAIAVVGSTIVILALALLGAWVEKALIRKTKIAEETALLYQKAEAANLTKSYFLANMSHEIRTPIGAILGFSELLISDDEMTENEKKEYLGIIHRNAQSLSQLLNDILDLSKVEMGQLKIECNTVDLKPLLEDVINLLMIKAREKGLHLGFESDPKIPAKIRTDALRLRQILINMIGNAIKFTEQGEVRVREKLLVQNQKKYLSYEVQDTGVGLAPDQIPKLFQAFSQADSSTTRRFGGTGLGLDISRKLARALGGDVVLIESRPEKGSRFLITVALQEEKMETESCHWN